MTGLVLHHGDCLEVLRKMADNSVDSVVTDPPYGLSFMGKKWDYDVPSTEIWAECLRVLKPGGHLLAFAGTRTQHRMAVRIEDAGFEIRDMIFWCYASGFPKSLDVSKAIGKAAGVGFMNAEGAGGDNVTKNQLVRSGKSTEAARQWQGWGTALKPALEPITVARKPLGKGMTVAANVLAHGTGALNIDGCRIPSGGEHKVAGVVTKKTTVSGDERKGAASGMYGAGAAFIPTNHEGGRWPANIIHDGSDEVLAAFPDAKGQQGDLNVTGRSRPSSGRFGDMAAPHPHVARKDDTTSAARFFYCPKTSKKERGADNNHPTVKPLDLMAYLCRLVTPPGGVVLDPFMGSGSTGLAALREGFRFVGIEREAAYTAIARARLHSVLADELAAEFV